MADKFGRQSPVILSSVGSSVSNDGVFYSGSTIYSPYDSDKSDTDVDTWFGDAIQVLVNDPISVNLDTNAGTPGLYAEKTQRDSSGEGFAITDTFAQSGVSPITNTTFTFNLDDTPSEYPNNVNVPAVGDYMRGAYQDFVKVTTSTNTAGSIWVITTEGRVSNIYLRDLNIPSTSPDLKFAYTINDLGWYSYRIVVKQTEQDYYNVYLPGILNGYPGQSGKAAVAGGGSAVSGGIDEGVFPNEINLTAHTVLFNDNINKIPRDLAEVGPDQKQYRSSVILYGRVTNVMTDENQGASDPGATANKQYFPRLQSQGKNAITHTSTAIANARDFNMAFTDLSGETPTDNTGGANGVKVFYEISSNPLIARISTTEKAIGWPNTNPQPTGEASGSFNMRPFLAVYETQATESLLDIYWETSTSGLIADLNSDVASTNTGIVGFNQINWEFDESTQPGSGVTSYFSPINNEGQIYLGLVENQWLTATSINGNSPLASDFVLAQGLPGSPQAGQFQIRYNPSNGDYAVFGPDSFENDIISFQITLESGDETFVIPLQGVQGGFGSLRNARPIVGSINASNLIESDPSQRVLITEAQITAANPKNGSGSSSFNRNFLKYYLIKDPNFPNGNNLPLNWSMDETTGELIQTTSGIVPSSGAYIPGNALGKYKVRLVVVDANGPVDALGLSFGYTPLSASVDFTIALNPARVNNEAKTPITECVVDNAFTGYDAGLPPTINRVEFDILVNQPIAKAFPGGIFGHHIVDDPSNREIQGIGTKTFLAQTGSTTQATDAGIGQLTQFTNNAGNSTAGCIYYIGNSDPLTAGAGASNTIINSSKGVNMQNLSNTPSRPIFYHKIGTKSHRSGDMVFTVNSFTPRRSEDYNGYANVIKLPGTVFYYRQPTDNDLNPNWTQLTRAQELNQVGRTNYINEDTISAPFSEAFSVYPSVEPGMDPFAQPGKLKAITKYQTNLDNPNEDPEYSSNRNAFMLQGRTLVTTQGNNSSWVQSVRAFRFDQLYNPNLSGANPDRGIEYAIQSLNQQQYNISNAEVSNNGCLRSWVVADDLNYPACAVWMNRNLVTQLASPGPDKLFPYKVRVNDGGNDPTEYKDTGTGNVGVSTLYARSPYTDYVDHFYTNETDGILFTPSSENEKQINFRIDRGALIGQDPANPIYTFGYSNSPNTGYFGNILPDSTALASFNMQLNAGFGWEGSAFPGRKLANPNSTTGVGAIRVFNPADMDALALYNLEPSYPDRGILRIKIN